MNVRLRHLLLTTRQTTERLDFAASVTFLYGPVGTGKSSVARLIDYCLGGDVERTPAIQQECIAAELAIQLGTHSCTIERALTDTQSVRISWTTNQTDVESINAPLVAGDEAIIGDDIYNLSDLLFHLCGVTPIKVRKRARDPDSPMIRLSFRDIWWYCYLEQTHLDSSFYRLEDPFRGRKSQDAMRFFTGLHSERLSQLETAFYRLIDEQQGKREAVRQIRQFMSQFELASELDIDDQIAEARRELAEAEQRRRQLEDDRQVRVHPTDSLRARLRAMGVQVADLQSAIESTEQSIGEQKALRAELITTKIKAERAEQAGRLLDGVQYERCPECGTDLSERSDELSACRLCRTPIAAQTGSSSLELEVTRRELNDRIDQIADSINRRTQALGRSKRQLEQIQVEKTQQDEQLQRELARYDSAFVESVRIVDREIATLTERLRSLVKLQAMPRAVNDLEVQAGAIQGQIDALRTTINEERSRLMRADHNIEAIAQKFKQVMLAVHFPGVTEDDVVAIDPRNWRPVIIHGDQEWSFWDAGSGGKKTLFNVCYALAIHQAARERGMPVPNLLIIDSPTKNISDDENPDLIISLYRQIYWMASNENGEAVQFLLIDSDLVAPEMSVPGFLHRHLAGTPDAPSLIPYYSGP